jgi:hypothetical protein
MEVSATKAMPQQFPKVANSDHLKKQKEIFKKIRKRTTRKLFLSYVYTS